MHFHETYLYKLHDLTTQLDKLFDYTLQHHAGLSLSQFLLLIAISQHNGINQRQVAAYLKLSPVAIKRQTDIAKERRLVAISPSAGKGNTLHLTFTGEAALHNGLSALERYAFSIFDQHNQNLNLMSHINLLLANIKKLKEQND